MRAFILNTRSIEQKLLCLRGRRQCDILDEGESVPDAAARAVVEHKHVPSNTGDGAGPGRGSVPAFRSVGIRTRIIRIALG
jgi:hypothetical protein